MNDPGVNAWVQRTLEAALAHHQANRYTEAEQLYRQVLQRQPPRTSEDLGPAGI